MTKKIYLGTLKSVLGRSTTVAIILIGIVSYETWDVKLFNVSISIRGTVLPCFRGSIAANGSKFSKFTKPPSIALAILLTSSCFLSCRPLSQMLDSYAVQQSIYLGEVLALKALIWFQYYPMLYHPLELLKFAYCTTRYISSLKRLLQLHLWSSLMAETNLSYLEALKRRMYYSPAALTELDP